MVSACTKLVRETDLVRKTAAMDPSSERCLSLTVGTGVSKWN